MSVWRSQSWRFKPRAEVAALRHSSYQNTVQGTVTPTSGMNGQLSRLPFSVNYYIKHLSLPVNLFTYLEGVTLEKEQPTLAMTPSALHQSYFLVKLSSTFLMLHFI